VVNNGGSAARDVIAARPDILSVLQREGGIATAEFSGTATWTVRRLLLDLGVPVTAGAGVSDGYDIAPMSLAD
jgi:hypothetical protein